MFKQKNTQLEVYNWVSSIKFPDVIWAIFSKKKPWKRNVKFICNYNLILEDYIGNFKKNAKLGICHPYHSITRERKILPIATTFHQNIYVMLFKEWMRRMYLDTLSGISFKIITINKTCGMFGNFLHGIYFILIFIYQINRNMTILTLIFT